MAREGTNPDGSLRRRDDQLARSVYKAEFPTPSATAYGSSGNGTGNNVNSRGRPSLEQMAKRNPVGWPTPRVTTNRASRGAMVENDQWSAPGLEQAAELAEGILPREFESPDELNSSARKMFYPTPESSSIRGPSKHHPERKDGGQPNLAFAVKFWPTPHGMAVENPRQAGPSGNELGNAVNRSIFPTPTAGDSEASGSRNTEASSAHAGVSLTDVVCGDEGRGRLFATPRAEDSQCAGQRVERGTSDTLYAQTVKDTNAPKGSLNPTWVEMLMGWPLFWTSLEQITDEQWPAIYGVWPVSMSTLQPDEEPRRTAVGVENRVGRLRAIGNGQVPLCVFAAWNQLSRRSGR